MLKCVTGNVNLMQSFPMNHNVLTQCQRHVSESVIWDLMCLPITFEASLIILLSGTLTITSLLILTILPLSKYTSPFSIAILWRHAQAMNIWPATFGDLSNLFSMILNRLFM